MTKTGATTTRTHSLFDSQSQSAKCKHIPTAMATSMAFKVPYPMWQRQQFVVQFPQIKRYHLQQNNFPNRKKLVIGGRAAKQTWHAHTIFVHWKCNWHGWNLFFFVWPPRWQQIELETHFNEQKWAENSDGQISIWKNLAGLHRTCEISETNK